MKKSTYILPILINTLVLLLSFSCQTAEVTNDEKEDKNYKKIIDSLTSSKKEKSGKIPIPEEGSRKIDKLPLRILSGQKQVDITSYIVKLYTYYGLIGNKEISGKGTATIIKIGSGIIYLLTCAHNVVKYIEIDPFNPKNSYQFYPAKSMHFSYKGTKYPCKSYYICPKYCEENTSKDVAIIVSHRAYGFSFPYSFFPETISVSENNYKGYILGFPGEFNNDQEIYGMRGDLNVVGNFVEYNNIDTYKGQSGAAIWADIDGFYKIIGVHTVGAIDCNYGPYFSKNIIDWTQKCWKKAQKVYHRYEKAFYQDIDLVNALEDSFFDIDMRVEQGRTPFLLAAQKGDLNLLKLLKKKGADIYAKDELEKNALSLAKEYSSNQSTINWLKEECSLPETEDSEKKEDVYNIDVTPRFLQIIPYDKWPANRRIVYSPLIKKEESLDKSSSIEKANIKAKDSRKKVEALKCKILPNKKQVDITKYVVKLYSYYGVIEGNEIVGVGTATIINVSEGLIYLMTCAHNVVRYEKTEDPFSPEGDFSSYYAKSIFFSYQGEKYSCKSYYIHPQYNSHDDSKDIAMVVSHSGYDLSFPYSFFPKTSLISKNKYKGCIIGLPKEKEKVYGMEGELSLSTKTASMKYNNIDTSKGYSGAAIWALIDDFYKIIGVHTGTDTCRALFDYATINWQRQCLIKAKKIYNKPKKDFGKGNNIITTLKDPEFDLSMKNECGKEPFIYAVQKEDLPDLKLLQAGE